MLFFWLFRVFLVFASFHTGQCLPFTRHLRTELSAPTPHRRHACDRQTGSRTAPCHSGCSATHPSASRYAHVFLGTSRLHCNGRRTLMRLSHHFCLAVASLYTRCRAYAGQSVSMMNAKRSAAGASSTRRSEPSLFQWIGLLSSMPRWIWRSVLLHQYAWKSCGAKEQAKFRACRR